MRAYGVAWTSPQSGVADRDTNFMQWTVSGGIGGRGLLASRGLATFGLGLFYTRVQETRFSGVPGLDDHSKGLETYYSIALTPATRLTLDLQVLDSPLPQADTDFVLGLRLSTRL